MSIDTAATTVRLILFVVFVGVIWPLPLWRYFIAVLLLALIGLTMLIKGGYDG
jgi:hypothetical protein